MPFPSFALLVLARTAIPLAVYLQPDFCARAMGVAPVDDAGALGYRLFAARELAVAAALTGVVSDHPAAVDAALNMGLLFDSVDAVSGLIAYRQGALGLAGLAFVSGGALLAVALGLSAKANRARKP